MQSNFKRLRIKLRGLRQNSHIKVFCKYRSLLLSFSFKDPPPSFEPFFPNKWKEEKEKGREGEERREKRDLPLYTPYRKIGNPKITTHGFET